MGVSFIALVVLVYVLDAIGVVASIVVRYCAIVHAVIPRIAVSSIIIPNITVIALVFALIQAGFDAVDPVAGLLQSLGDVVDCPAHRVGRCVYVQYVLGLFPAVVAVVVAAVPELAVLAAEGVFQIIDEGLF